MSNRKQWHFDTNATAYVPLFDMTRNQKGELVFDEPEPNFLYVREDYLDALRKRNEKLERVAETARETMLRRNEDSDGLQVKTTPWRDAAGKPFYIVDAKPADRLMDALSDLDKED